MSELFQDMCKLLQEQGKVEKFHLGLNQTMCHYVNKYGNYWDEFVNYALMVHRAIPHSITRYSPFYLLHGRQMRLPVEDDITTGKFLRVEPKDKGSLIQDHIHTLADRLDEAYRVARENNKVGRERQKEWYDKGTRLVIFQPGEMVYLRQMNKVKCGCPKFRLGWRGPYEVVRRLSDLNYLVRVSQKKELVVNVNKMKRCCMKTVSAPSGTRDIAVRVQERDESQDVADDEGITPLASYDHVEDEGSSVFTPTTFTGERTEDRSQDPTWEPSRHQEVPRAAAESPDTGREAGARYWLRSRPGEDTVAPERTPTEIEGERIDPEETDAEPPPSALPEAGNVLAHEEGTEQPPRYNFRPLPGRKI
jgi:hypothetical protein